MRTKQKYGVMFMILIVILFSQLGFAKEKEKIHKIKVISSDLEDRELPEIEIDDSGSVDIWIELNETFCGINSLEKRYYLFPEGLDWYLNYTSLIYVDDDCNPRLYYEKAKFNLLGKNLTEGIYYFYRDYDGAPLFMSKIKIKGNIPRATIANGEEVNITLLNKLLERCIEFLDYLKRYLGDEFEPKLSVTTVKWIHVGDLWRVEANYTDQKGKSVTNRYCKLNTDRWGVIDMTYDWERKLYIVEKTADYSGKMRWTVSCY